MNNRGGQANGARRQGRVPRGGRHFEMRIPDPREVAAAGLEDVLRCSGARYCGPGQSAEQVVSRGPVFSPTSMRMQSGAKGSQIGAVAHQDLSVARSNAIRIRNGHRTPTEGRHAEVTAEFVARRLLHQMDVTIFCTSVAADPRCPDCGRVGRCRDTVIRALTDLAVPTWGHEQSSLQMRSAVQHAVASVLANDRYPPCGRCLWITPSS